MRNSDVRKIFLELYKDHLKAKDRAFNRLLFVDYVDQLEKEGRLKPWRAHCIAYPAGKLFN